MRGQRWTGLVISAALALGGGCATFGRKFDTTHVHSVQKGQDKDQMLAWFGPPTQKATFARNAGGCVERWQYTHAYAVAGGSSRAEVLIVDLDDRGLVCDTAFSEVNQ